MKTRVLWIVVVLAVVFVLFSCVTKEDVQKTHDEVARAQEIIKERIAQLEVYLAKQPDPHDPMVKLLQHELTVLQESEGLAAKALVELETTLETWENPQDPLGMLASQLLPFLPPQYQPIGVSLVALGGLFWRVRAWKTGAVSIGKSLEALKGGVAKDVLATNADTLNKIQTPTGKLAVDLAQGKTNTFATSLFSKLPI